MGLPTRESYMVLVCLFDDQFQYLILMATVKKKEIKHSPSNESGESVLLKGMLMNGLTWKFFPKLGV